MTATSSCQEKLAGARQRLRVTLVAFNARYVHSCLALFYIREEFARHLPEASVEILQLTINDNPYESLLRINATAPDAVFISAAIWNSDLVARMVADVRASHPECRIVVGGPEASALRLRLTTCGCTVVLGEIEAVGERLCRDLAADNLQQLYQGSFLRLGHKRLLSPYRDGDFAGELKNRHIYFESSRGCPHSCTYCLSASEAGLYHKDLDQVKQELRQVLGHRPKVVRFIDRTFNDVPARALAIWQFLAAEGGETLFHFEIAPDRFTEEMFSFLATIAPGRFQFEIGIQSTNPETLAAIRRRIDIDQVGPIVARLAALANIHLHVDLILALPYETKESFATSFRQVFAMGAHYIQMGLLKILPDTPICHGAAEYGYVHSSHPPYAVFASKWLDHQEVRELYWFSEGVEKFHNNRYFPSLWQYLREQGDDSYGFFQQLLVAGEDDGLSYRSVTQELLCELLTRVCGCRPDWPLIRDLLRYDWLRCGFRNLPGCLGYGEGEEWAEATRDSLYQLLPVELTGAFAAHQRNQFFKRGTFLRIGAEAARLVGLAGGEGAVRLVIQPEREESLFMHNRVQVFPVNEAG